MNITIPIVAAASAALILTPVGHADPSDDANYLEELNMLGMNPANLHRASLQGEIDLGQAICLDLGVGGRQSPNDMVTAMSRSLPNLSRSDSDGHLDSGGELLPGRSPAAAAMGRPM